MSKYTMSRDLNTSFVVAVAVDVAEAFAKRNSLINTFACCLSLKFCFCGNLFVGYLMLVGESM